MAKRSRGREIVLQILFQYDINPDVDDSAVDTFLRARLRNDEEVIEFSRGLWKGVMRNRGELDAMLTEKAVNWSLERMAIIDRNILRMGAFEIVYGETPGRVAINEALELAKRYGTKQSAQFVNGVLDQFLPLSGKDK